MTIQTKRGTAFYLTEEQRQEAIKACHDGIANAKNIVDAAEGKKDASLGYALSAAFRALLCILTSDRNPVKDKPEPKPEDNKWRYYLD